MVLMFNRSVSSVFLDLVVLGYLASLSQSLATISLSLSLLYSAAFSIQNVP